MAFDAWPPLFHHGKDDNEWMEIEQMEWDADWVREVGCKSVYRRV